METAFVLDRYGNNAAIQCPSCNKAFVISELLNRKNGRKCPHCENALATFSGEGQLTCELLRQAVSLETQVRGILAVVKPLAAKFYRLTGKPLGVAGEVAEFVASELLQLKLVPARTIGYDALRGEERIQTKGRAYGLMRSLGSGCLG